MNEVLITGARGYIGGRLVEHLARADFSVRAGSRRPPAALASGGSIGNIKMDFDSPKSISAAVRGCNAIVHLASLNEIDSALDPEAATLVNTIYTQRLARMAAEAHVQRFIYFSTVHVYGSPLAGRLTERSSTDPVHPYSISHKSAEDYLRFMAGKSNMRVAILRLTNSYGYPATKDINRWTLVANDAARQLAETGKVVLKTPGTQPRDFIALSDVCNAVEFFLKRRSQESNCELFNLGAGRSLSIFEFVSRICHVYSHITGQIPPIERPGTTLAAMPEFLVDIRKLKTAGFEVSDYDDKEIEELLRRCLSWFGPQNQE